MPSDQVSGKHLWQIYWPGPDFVPPVVSARIVVLRVPKQLFYRIHDRTMGWGKRTTGPIDVVKIPADHRTILREPGVQVLADGLAFYAEQALNDVVVKV